MEQEEFVDINKQRCIIVASKYRYTNKCFIVCYKPLIDLYSAYKC